MTYVFCTDCGLGFALPLPTQKELVRFYRTFHTDHNYKAIDRRLVHNVAFKHRLVEKPAARSGLTAPLRMLDIGRGLGQYMMVASRAGHQVSGIDVAPDAVRFARERHGLRTVHCGDLLENDRYKEASLDVITMWAVIEHVRDPVAYVRKAYQLLCPGGLIVVDTGSVGDYLDWWMIGPSRWIWPPGHLFYFNTGSLVALLERQGFSRTWSRLNVRENILVTAANHAYSIGHTLPRSLWLRLRRALGRPGNEQATNRDCNLILAAGWKPREATTRGGETPEEAE